MRPITNILLVLAIICYVFLPFYDISFLGTVTGMEFTAGTITQSLSLGSVLLALLPFIACFGAIALNCLKSHWWVLGTIVCIFVCLWFFRDTSTFHEILLEHNPDVVPVDDIGEGFSIKGLGIGYWMSCILTLLALLSAIVSLLPFKFNQRLEEAIDHKFEDGQRHVREEFKRFENAHKSHKTNRAAKHSGPTPPPVQDEAPAAPQPEPEEDKEDPSRFMPK